MRRQIVREAVIRVLRDPRRSKRAKVSRGKSIDADDDWWLDDHKPDSLTIYEEEDDLVDTGLLDARGNPLYREKNRLPIGFRGSK